jgi:hypothetical protein
MAQQMECILLLSHILPQIEIDPKDPPMPCLSLSYPLHMYRLSQQIAQSTARLRSRLRRLCSWCAGARRGCTPQALTRLLLGQVAHGDLLCWSSRLFRRGASKQRGKSVSTGLFGCRSANFSAWRHDGCRGCRLWCAHVDRSKVVGPGRLIACGLLRTHDGRGDHLVRCRWW